MAGSEAGSAKSGDDKKSGEAKSDGAGDPPSSDDGKSKPKVSIPGVVALVFMIIGAALCVTAVISMPWRLGAGSSGPYAGLLGPDFKERKYFMFYVEGVTKRSWHDLTVLTCDKAAKVEITISGAADGICDTDLAAQLPEKCSKKFLPHVKDRCHVYNFLTAINGAFSTLTFVDAGLALILGALGAAPILKGLQKFYLPTALSIGFSSLAQLGAWMYMSDEKFTFIGRSAEFPYPGVATGFWVHFGGSLCYAIGAFFYFPVWARNPVDDGDDEKKEGDEDEKKEGEEKEEEAEPI